MKGLAVRLLVLALPLAACGSEIHDDGTGGTTSSSSAATGGADPCEAPSGERLCFGPNDCDPLGCPDGTACYENEALMVWDSGGEGIGYCQDLSTSAESLDMFGCADGHVFSWMFDTPPYVGYCVTEAMAQLYCEADRGDLIYFTDFGTYDCSPLPAPTDCPAVDGFKLCGDACGSCGPDEVCRGRSRLHPYSMCFPILADYCRRDDTVCDDGFACFIYTVDEAHQYAADALGACLPVDTCDAAAADLPGGAECLH